MQPQLCYRVGNKYFDTIAEASAFCASENDKQNLFLQNKKYILDKKEEVRNTIKDVYINSGLTFDQCNCLGQDYSSQCLKHLCTCGLFSQFTDKEYDSLICDHHTNQFFKNGGCYWCRHSDCSKWYC
ncbi:putative ORFan [Tupanvirus deep ocean]|uniref:ORFan n=2 Tax=Tupanvirus TaxID=2094720 RepID=A0AC62A8G3_9VIRU|nr:putative ORFan [Tupanvirus deep ocean]QKU34064.1 putative ORFan [Tupanvirus deep ocean]